MGVLETQKVTRSTDCQSVPQERQPRKTLLHCEHNNIVYYDHVTYPTVRMTLDDATANRETREVIFVMCETPSLHSSLPHFLLSSNDIYRGSRCDVTMAFGVVGYAAAAAAS
jgi:hypothetical protein